LALIALLKRTLDNDRYPSSPRLNPLKAILASSRQPSRPSRSRRGPVRRHAESAIGEPV